MSAAHTLLATTPINALVGFEVDQLAKFAACNFKFKDRFIVPFTNGMKMATILRLATRHADAILINF